MSATLADPVRMIQMGAPRLIDTDEELAEYTRELFALIAKEEPTGDEIDAINLLSALIDRYQNRRFPVPDVSGLEMLRYLMELKGISQSDLIPLLGTQSLVSMIVGGTRKMTVAHIAALSRFFGVSPEVFFPAR
jgi:HTH-type transcriptional regulator/antitoxin HigA